MKDLLKVLGKILLAVTLATAGFIVMIMKFTKRDSHLEPLDKDNDGHVEFQVTMGGGEKYVNTDHFEKAYLSSKLGDMEVFFDNAEMAGDKAVIDVEVSFGAIELYVPKNWRVDNNVKVLMGAVEYNNDSEVEQDKVIQLNGNVVCGAVEIEYV